MREPEEEVATIVRTTCSECGDVELAAEDVLLRICSHAPASTYRFTCPVCARGVDKPADERVVQLLTSVGVPVAYWSFPAELTESREGPALTSDDLLDFHQLLESPDWFDRLARQTTSS